jgi:hypothetical protein
MNILVIAPHSSLILWDKLQEVFKEADQCNEVFGLTFLEDISKAKPYFKDIFQIKESEIKKNKDIKSNMLECIPNINQIIIRDRWLDLMEKDKALLILENIYVEVLNIFNDNKFDLLVGEISCATNEIVYHLSKQLKIPFYQLSISPYKNRYFLTQASDIYGPKYFIEQQLNTFDLKSPKTEKGELSSETVQNIYSSKPQINIKKKQLKVVLRNILWIIRESLKFKNSIFSYSNNTIKTNILSITRILGFNKRFFNKTTQKLPGKYFIFFLHYEPDLATFVWATNYKDQLYQLRQICNNLPNNTFLIVKEHPLSILTRPNSFYKSLNKLPNLILVDSAYNKLELIKKSKGIITICGTIGYEAWLLGKKILTLGNMFYNSFPDISAVNNYNQLNFYLTELLNNQNTSTTEEERFRIDNYIKNNCTVEGSIFSYETKFNKMFDEEKIINMRNLRDYILNDLNKK